MKGKCQLNDVCVHVRAFVWTGAMSQGITSRLGRGVCWHVAGILWQICGGKKKILEVSDGKTGKKYHSFTVRHMIKK